MKFFMFIFVGIALGRCDKLDRTYLPPPGSRIAGGSPGALLGPLDTPYSAPNAQNIDHQSLQGPEFIQGIQKAIRHQEGTGNIPHQNIKDLAIQPALPNTFIPELPINASPQSSVTNLRNYNVPTTTTSYAFTQTTTHPSILGDFESSTIPPFAFTAPDFNAQPIIPKQLFPNNQNLPNQENIPNSHIHDQSRPYSQNHQPNFVHRPQNNIFISPDEQPQVTDTQFNDSFDHYPLHNFQQIAGNDVVSPSFPSQFLGTSTSFPQLNDHFNNDQSSIASNNSNIESPTVTPRYHTRNQNRNQIESTASTTLPDFHSRNQYHENIQSPTNSPASQFQLLEKMQQVYNKPLLDNNQNYRNLNVKFTPAGENTNDNININEDIQSYQSDNIPSEVFGQPPAGSANFATSTVSSSTPEIFSPLKPSQVGMFNKNIQVIRKPERIQAQDDRNAYTLNYDNIITPDGDFAYSFDTSNGIHADESGTAKDGVKAQGAFSYIGDDGKNYSIIYTADENGYRPQGDHLPTPPPIPEAILKVIEQAYKDKEAGIFHDGSYDDEKYGYKNYEKPLNKYKIQTRKNQLDTKPEISLKQENRFYDIPAVKIDEKLMDKNYFENNEPYQVDDKEGQTIRDGNFGSKISNNLSKINYRHPTQDFRGENIKLTQTNGEPTNNIKSGSVKDQFNNNYRSSISNKNQLLPEESDLNFSQDTESNIHPELIKDDNRNKGSYDQDIYDDNRQNEGPEYDVNNNINTKFENTQLLQNSFIPNDIKSADYFENDEVMIENVRNRKPVLNQQNQFSGDYDFQSTPKPTFRNTEEETGYEYFPPKQQFQQETADVQKEGLLNRIEPGNQNLKLRPFMTPNGLLNQKGSFDIIQPSNGERSQNNFYRQQIINEPATVSPYKQIKANSQYTNPDNFKIEHSQKSKDTTSTKGPHNEQNTYPVSGNNRYVNQRISTTPTENYPKNQLVSSTTSFPPQNPTVYGSTKSEPIQNIHGNNRGPYSTNRPSETDSTLSPDYVSNQNIISKFRPTMSPTGYSAQPKTNPRINVGPRHQETGTLGNFPSTTYRPNYSINDITTPENYQNNNHFTTPKYIPENSRNSEVDDKETNHTDGLFDHSTVKPIQKQSYQHGSFNRPTYSKGSTYTQYPTTEQRIFPTSERPHQQERQNSVPNIIGQPDTEGSDLEPHQGLLGSAKVIGEDFNRPNRPQYFDPKTGYHY